MSKEVMKLALSTLEGWANYDDWVWPESALEQAKRNTIEAITALRQALETEPFEYWNAVEGWVKIDEVREHFDAVGCGTIYKSAGEGRSPLYTAPPKQWVGLTEIEICDIEADELTSASSETFAFARAIEAKLKEKNT
jgi:hypothetical protein